MRSVRVIYFGRSLPNYEVAVVVVSKGNPKQKIVRHFKPKVGQDKRFQMCGIMHCDYNEENI